MVNLWIPTRFDSKVIYTFGFSLPRNQSLSQPVSQMRIKHFKVFPSHTKPRERSYLPQKLRMNHILSVNQLPQHKAFKRHKSLGNSSSSKLGKFKQTRLSRLTSSLLAHLASTSKPASSSIFCSSNSMSHSTNFYNRHSILQLYKFWVDSIRSKEGKLH